MRWPLDSSEHVSFLRTRVGDFTSPEVRKKNGHGFASEKHFAELWGEEKDIRPT